MPRIIWKGAITFGLVHVPVALYPASQEIGIDFDWLDKRTMDPVGYKRINKRTGKEVDPDDIVKGIKQPDGEYVVLSEEEIKAAYPFVQADQIPFTYLEKPYYLAPAAKGEKVYALLRDAMVAAKVVGVARVVMHTKEQLAALIPDGDALLLNTIRWAEEIRPRDEIAFPPQGKGAAQPKESELKMAVQLIRDMTGPWNPAEYRDKFTDAIHALAAQRVQAGQTETVTPLEHGAAPVASNVVDLTELLKKSLATRKGGARAGAGAAAAAPSSGAERAAAKKPATKSAKAAATSRARSPHSSKAAKSAKAAARRTATVKHAA
jgi:DNA end-binding protein Ku